MCAVVQIDNMVDIKYIFCDLDGTLLNEKKEISLKSVALLKQIKEEKQILLGIATGRTLRFVLNILKTQELTSVFDVIVANNGVEVYEVATEEKKELQKLDPSVIDDIVETFKCEKGINIAFHNPKGFFATKRDEVVEEILKVNGLHDCYSPIVDEYESTPRVMLIFNAEERNKIVPNLKTKTIKYAKGLLSMNDTYEFIHENVSKANGIQYFIQKKRDTLLNVMAFGDSENDIEMIMHSGIGVAMKNATSQIKENSNFVCDYTNDEDGIYHFLKRYKEYIWER